MGPLPDYLPRPCRVLFVGLNPGMRSAAVGHHFAGATNKFWRLMVDAGFLPPGSSWINDSDLPQLQLGITNLVPRATPGVTDLNRSDYERGARATLEKIRSCSPRIVALVGITVYRELLGVRGPVSCGLAAETLDGALVWVLPNPSGRNAHFSYREMLRYFRALKRLADRVEPGQPP
jgi:TDG/mug DNA glycosylase family protein